MASSRITAAPFGTDDPSYSEDGETAIRHLLACARGEHDFTGKRGVCQWCGQSPAEAGVEAAATEINCPMCDEKMRSDGVCTNCGYQEGGDHDDETPLMHADPQTINSPPGTVDRSFGALVLPSWTLDE